MTTPPTISDVLSRAADLIEPEGAWTQGAYARDPVGHPTRPTSPNAACWCVLGAIRRAGGYEDDREARPAIDALNGAFSRRPKFIHTWNDQFGRKQSEVVSKLREASSKAKERGL